MLDNAVVMGNIYDPDSDCQFVLLRVTSKDWDKFQRELKDEEE